MKIIVDLKEILREAVQFGESQTPPFPRSMTLGNGLSLGIIVMRIK